uniref:NADH-ubiquinone oxidoreductase chain 5 n=1 Tax=Rhizophydium sp. 136 TaxID=60187 RepID=Q950M3_9FUNG|nr:NADH dehydrogenase subunit 5 [Rhizophydium sp. 136]AAK84285.1 NADH dehydrogenase subunit 5 [Rhizophydium sp. 136]
MYLTIILLPLLSSIFSTNRKCGMIVGPILCILTMFFAAVFTLLLFYEVGINNSSVNLNLGSWVDFGPILIDWSFIFDALTVSMYLPIVIITFLILIYSNEYLGHDPHKSRFFSLLSLFAFTMLLLVSGDNLLLMFAGLWEGVGIVSWALVNFWYTRIAANQASLSALFLNKIGDYGFILALVLSIALFSDLSLATIFNLGSYINGDLLFLFTLSILIAAMAKSAMIGLHSWLPKAKEGPTSVSALLHSSTMVTAGVFLLIRISPLLEFSSTTLMIIIWLGSLGCLFGAATGLIINDLKGIIAYSTMSQLGYMIVAVGISQYNVALFHLITHAFFKSLLFLASGAVLHAVMDNQDIRKMGGLNIHLPYTYLVFLFGSLSLMAFPFTAGFYSKDFLLEILLVPNNFTHTIAYIFTLLGALLTSTYSARTKMIALLSRPLFQKSIVHYVKDSGMFMTIPLLILSVAAVIIGYITNEIFITSAMPSYFNSIFIHPDNIRILDAPNANSIMSLIPLLFLFILFTALIIKSPSLNNSSSIKDTANQISLNSTSNSSISNNHAISLINQEMSSPENNKVLIGVPMVNNLTILIHFNIFNHWFMHRILILSNYLYRYIDKGILETIGPTGFSRTFHFIGFLIELLATGNILNYALIIIFSILFIIILLFGFFI